MPPFVKYILKGLAVLGVLGVLFLPQVVEAQGLFGNRKRTKEGLPNLPKYDRRLFHFGFTLGMNYADFSVKHEENLGSYDSLYSAEQIGQVGFNLGIVTDMRMGPWFNLRFIPGISFVGRQMQYNLIQNDTVPTLSSKPTESVFFDFPLYVKFKSRRLGDFRAYILAGGKFSIDMASEKDVEADEIILRLSKFDYTYDMGVGVDLYLEYFKLSIEGKVAFGLNNMLVRDGTVFTESISSLNSKTFLLSFYFE